MGVWVYVCEPRIDKTMCAWSVAKRNGIPVGVVSRVMRQVMDGRYVRWRPWNFPSLFHLADEVGRNSRKQGL